MIVTKDVDFLEMQQILGFPPKLVWMNCGNASNIIIQKKLVDNADAIRKMLSTTDAGVVEID
jgi:predicted nuclease of predicted toxin-antitoxin system